MIVKFEKYIRNTLEANVFKSVFEYFFGIIEDKANILMNDIFIRTASLPMIRLWEKFLGITPDETLTLEERRGQVLLKRMAKPPYTLKSITDQIQSICGTETLVKMDYTKLKLSIYVNNLTSYADRMTRLYLNMVKPVTVVYELLEWANTWEDVYNKGTWEDLHNYNWEDIYSSDDFRP